MTQRRWRWVLGILGALVVWVVVIVPQTRGPAQPRELDATDFMVRCHMAVRDRLKAPSTAEFAPVGSADVQGGPGSYRLTGTVEAQNALGVPLRTAYTCTGAPEAPAVTLD